jgi:hypothetical protein
MNAFEIIVGQCLEAKGYWVRHSVKVELTKEEKREIGSPTMPRPEIDLVALRVEKNELILVEVKSLLDRQYGIYIEAFTDEEDRDKGRYKLFTNPKFREIVTRRLRSEYLKKGLIRNDTGIRYGLAAGKIHKSDEEEIRKHFSKNEWTLFTPDDIRNELRQFKDKSWEDDVVTMTVKLLLRDERRLR